MSRRVTIETDDIHAHPFGPILLVRYIAKSLQPRRSAKQLYVIEHDGEVVGVDKEFIDDCSSDLALTRWYRNDANQLVMVYCWTN